MAGGPLAGVRSFLRRVAARGEGAPASDGQLLRRFLDSREEEAFAALVARHGPMVMGVCRRVLQNEQDVEDAFQTTFLVLARKAPLLASRDGVGGWLHGVAYRTALKARSGAALRRLKEERAARPEAREEPAATDLSELIDRELSCLPDRYRAPLVLCDLGGASRKDAAAELGWKEGTLSGRLARGRALLARRLARRGVALAGGLSAVLGTVARASVSAPLASATARAALAEGIMKTVWLGKFNLIATALLAVAALTVGGLATAARAPAVSSVRGSAQAASPRGPAAPAHDERAKDKATVPPPKDPGELIRGGWRVTEAHTNGPQSPREREVGQRWFIDGEAIAIHYQDGERTTLGYRLHPREKPAALTVIETTPGGTRYTYLGIYDLDGDRLKVRYTRNVHPAARRPTTFDARDREFSDDRGARLFVLERERGVKQGSGKAENEAEALFLAMESKLQAATSLKAAGALTFKEKGDAGKMTLALQVGAGNKSRLEVSGTAAGGGYKVVAVSDGKTTLASLPDAEKPREEATPKNFNELLKAAVARVGFVGLVTFAARGAGGEGLTAERLFRVSKFRAEPDAKAQGRDAKVIKYYLEVEGEKNPAWVTLWIDAKTLLPVRRAITPEGRQAEAIAEDVHEMSLDAKLDPKGFELPR